MPREQRVRNPVAPAFDSHAPKPKDEPEVDYEAMTVADLKGLLAQRGISVPSKALKADLVTALRGA